MNPPAGTTSFCTNVTDGTGQYTYACATITRLPCPAAANDTYTGVYNQMFSPATGDDTVLVNDNVSCDASAVKALVWVGTPDFGTVTAWYPNGSFVYQPPPFFSGEEPGACLACDAGWRQRHPNVPSCSQWDPVVLYVSCVCAVPLASLAHTPPGTAVFQYNMSNGLTPPRNSSAWVHIKYPTVQIVATDNSYTGSFNTPLSPATGNLILEDDNSTNPNPNLQLVTVGQPSGNAGSVTWAPNGTWTFNPSPGWSGGHNGL